MCELCIFRLNKLKAKQIQLQMKNFKQVKRLKRSELIAQKERTKLLHRFKKELRKEKQADLKAVKKPAYTSQQPNTAKFFTSQKKAQLEYEAKLKEKQAKLEVRFFANKKNQKKNF